MLLIIMIVERSEAVEEGRAGGETVRRIESGAERHFIVREAKPTDLTVVASEPEAKEPLIIMLMVVVLLILTVVQFILFDFVEICKIWRSTRRWG